MHTKSELAVHCPSSPNWAFALERMHAMDPDEVIAAVQVALDFWGDEAKPESVSEQGAKLFILEQISIFTESCEDEQTTGVRFATLPDGYDGYRDPVRSATLVLGACGILQAAGYKIFSDRVEPSAWPEGEEDPSAKIQ